MQNINRLIQLAANKFLQFRRFFNQKTLLYSNGYTHIFSVINYWDQMCYYSVKERKTQYKLTN